MNELNHKPQIHNQLLIKLHTLIVETASHWMKTNQTLRTDLSLVVLEDVNSSAFEALVAGLDPLREALDLARGWEQSAVDRLDGLHAALRRWLLVYRGMVQGSVPGSKWERWLVLTPQKQCSPELLRIAAQVTLHSWGSLDAELLRQGGASFRRLDGSGLVEFRAAVEAFAAAQLALWDAEWEVAYAEVSLSMALEQLAAVVVRYPTTVKSRLPAGHRLLDSLPKR